MDSVSLSKTSLGRAVCIACCSGMAGTKPPELSATTYSA